MPRGDGTGPAGMGPMTGRAAGDCTGFSQPGAINNMNNFNRPSVNNNVRRNNVLPSSSGFAGKTAGRGRGRGSGRGMGRGRRR